MLFGTSRSNNSTNSFQSEPSSTRPCCIRTPAASLCGRNVNRVWSPAIALLSPSRNVDDARFQAERQILLQANRQIAPALLLLEVAEGAKLGAVLRAGLDLVRRAQ